MFYGYLSKIPNKHIKQNKTDTLEIAVLVGTHPHFTEKDNRIGYISFRYVFSLFLRLYKFAHQCVCI